MERHHNRRVLVVVWDLRVVTQVMSLVFPKRSPSTALPSLCADAAIPDTSIMLQVLWWPRQSVRRLDWHPRGHLGDSEWLF